MNSDETSNKDGVVVGVVLVSSFIVDNEEVFQVKKSMTNNEAEYEALLYGLE